jgi:hypothetical protein
MSTLTRLGFGVATVIVALGFALPASADTATTTAPPPTTAAPTTVAPTTATPTTVAAPVPAPADAPTTDGSAGRVTVTIQERADTAEPDFIPVPEMSEPEAPAPDSDRSDRLVNGATGTGTTNTEQQLTITIDSPADGSSTPVPPGEIEVTGKVSIGLLSLDVNVLYIVDVSGSTGSPDNQDCNGDGAANAADDINGNGSVGDTLDCEIAGVQALNDSLTGLSGVEVGVIPFNSSAATSDVSPNAGNQPFTTPAADDNSNGTNNIDEVVEALNSGGGTNFNSALAAMNTAFATQPAGESNVAYFLSDGFGSLSTGAGSALQAAIDAGTVVNTFSVGSGASGCDVGDDLRTIADSTGGKCFQVDDPSKLAQLLGDLKPAGIDRVEVSLNGGPPVVADLDALGNWKVKLTGLVVGPNSIQATVVADDGTEVVAAANQSLPATRVSADIVVNGVGPAVAAATTTIPEAAPTQVASAQPSSSQLAFTGVGSSQLALVAALAMLAGACFILSARVRSRLN